MILGVFIEFFGVKIVIKLSKTHFDLILTIGFYLSKNSQYFIDIYQYISDIYRYFFRNFNICAREIKSRNFVKISRISNISMILSIFHRFFPQLIIDRQNLFGIYQ